VFDAAKKLKAAGHPNCGFGNAWVTVGQPRAALGLAQPAPLHQVQRHGRLGHGAHLQQPAAREAPGEPRRAAEGQDLRLLGAHQHG
jgi:hypothetical protein